MPDPNRPAPEDDAGEEGGSAVPPDAPAEGVLDEDDPNPPEPQEPG